jgi:hypothetical protein
MSLLPERSVFQPLNSIMPEIGLPVHVPRQHARKARRAQGERKNNDGNQIQKSQNYRDAITRGQTGISRRFPG